MAQFIMPNLENLRSLKNPLQTHKSIGSQPYNEMYALGQGGKHYHLAYISLYPASRGLL